MNTFKGLVSSIGISLVAQNSARLPVEDFGQVDALLEKYLPAD